MLTLINKYLFNFITVNEMCNKKTKLSNEFTQINNIISMSRLDRVKVIMQAAYLKLYHLEQVHNHKLCKYNES